MTEQLSQFDKVVKILNGKYPRTTFSVGMEDNSIKIEWTGLPSQYDVFKDISWLSSRFNSLEGEEAFYPHGIRCVNHISPIENKQLKDQLILKMRENNSLSNKLINRNLGGSKLQVAESLNLVNSVVSLRHLIDDNFENYRTRMQSVQNVLNTTLLNNYQEEFPQAIIDYIQETLYNDDVLIQAFEQTRNSMVNNYFTNDLPEIFDRVIRRKIQLVKEMFKPDVPNINREVFSRLIREKHHADPKLEHVLGQFTSEQLNSHLFGLPDEMSYQEQLENELNILLSSETTNYSLAEKLLLRHAPLTIDTLQGFESCERKEVMNNPYLVEKVDENREIFFTDTFIILRNGNDFAVKKSVDVQDKQNILQHI